MQEEKMKSGTIATCKRKLVSKENPDFVLANTGDELAISSCYRYLATPDSDEKCHYSISFVNMKSGQSIHTVINEEDVDRFFDVRNEEIIDAYNFEPCELDKDCDMIVLKGLKLILLYLNTLPARTKLGEIGRTLTENDLTVKFRVIRRYKNTAKRSYEQMHHFADISVSNSDGFFKNFSLIILPGIKSEFEATIVRMISYLESGDAKFNVYDQKSTIEYVGSSLMKNQSISSMQNIFRSLLLPLSLTENFASEFNDRKYLIRYITNDKLKKRVDDLKLCMNKLDDWKNESDQIFINNKNRLASVIQILENKTKVYEKNNEESDDISS